MTLSNTNFRNYGTSGCKLLKDKPLCLFLKTASLPSVVKTWMFLLPLHFFFYGDDDSMIWNTPAPAKGSVACLFQQQESNRSIFADYIILMYGKSNVPIKLAVREQVTFMSSQCVENFSFSSRSHPTWGAKLPRTFRFQIYPPIWPSLFSHRKFTFLFSIHRVWFFCQCSNIQISHSEAG